MKYLLIALLALIPTITFGGTVILRDGKTVTGDVKLTDGKLILTAPDQPAREIGLDQITHVSFTSEAPAPVAAVDDPIVTERSRRETARERSKEAQSRPILAEYYDAEFKKRLAIRYEATVSQHYRGAETPDPQVPPYFAVRFTARYVPKRTGPYIFSVEAHGPDRRGVARKTLIDGEAKVGPRVAEPIQLTADQPVEMVYEVTTGKTGYLSRLACVGPPGGPQSLSADSFMPPVNAPPPPSIHLTGPIDGSYVRLPAEVTLSADASFSAEGPAGKIAKVEFLAAKIVIGEAAKPPYTFTWKTAAAGFHRITARVTSTDGISVISLPRYLAVAGQGKNQSLPAPWGEQTVPETRREIYPMGSASFANGVFTLTKAGGQIADGDDECHLVHQPVKGDFTLTARLVSLTPPDPIVGPAAGIIIKDRLNGEGRFAAALVSTQSIISSKRTEGYAKASNTEVAAPLPAGARQIEGRYLRLQRHGMRVRTFTSRDGKEWEILSNDRIAFADQLYVGLCAMSRNVENPAVAVFDQVELTLGAPEMAESASGVLFTNGTFLACNTSSIKDGRLYYTRAGKERLTLPITDIARIVYRPIPAELAQSLPAGSSGVLLASGDFAEGTIKDVSYHVTISNLVFGNRTFAIKNGETVLAVVLKDPVPPKVAPQYTVTAHDGSVYHSESIKPGKESLALQDAMLGAVDLPAAAIAEIKVNR